MRSRFSLIDTIVSTAVLGLVVAGIVFSSAMESARIEMINAEDRYSNIVMDIESREAAGNLKWGEREHKPGTDGSPLRLKLKQGE